MKSNNDLDNFYKRKLENAAVTPPEDVWDNISSRLPEKKPTVLPLWYKIAGAAAIAILLLNLGKGLRESSPIPSENKTTFSTAPNFHHEIEKASQEFHEVMEHSSRLLLSLIEESDKRRLEEKAGTEEPKDFSTAAGSISSSLAETKKGSETGSKENNLVENGSVKINTTRTAAISSNTAAILPNPLNGNQYITTETSAEKTAAQTAAGQSRIAETVATEKEATKNALASQKSSEGYSDNEKKESSPVMQQNVLFPEPMGGSHRRHGMATLEEKFQPDGNYPQSEPISTGGEDDLFSRPEKKKNTHSRVSISTKVAPVIFRTGGGNAFDPQFSSNSAAGEVSVSYGVSFAYRLSKKIKLRSGVSRVDLAYHTKNVDFNSAVSSTALNDAPMAAVLSSPLVGNLNQQMGFTEIPVEVEYLLTDKRFGLSLLLGGSSLFLDDNSVSLDASAFSTDLGEANNLNSFSFTTNIGLGLNYKISPKFQLNMEPILKYQINTFKSSSLNPHYFGIYSGFTFSF